VTAQTAAVSDLERYDAPPRKSIAFRVNRQIIPAFFLTFAVALACLALFAPVIAPHDPQQQSLKDRLHPPAWSERGDWSHPLGTDNLGRDILSRLIYGSRITLTVIGLSIPATALLGSLVGILGGYFRGWIDALIMRIADVQLALPAVLFAVLLAAVYGPGLRNVILIIIGWRWATYARVVRAEVLSLRERDFISAAQSLGATDLRIVLRHLAPNIVNTIIVLASLDLAVVVLVEASLSFLGVGVPPTTVSWGTMVSEGRSFIGVAWWLVTFPGLSILLIALLGNLSGDWLRDRLDPRLRNLGR
jgi:peptide/nickel transport system permease protein